MEKYKFKEPHETTNGFWYDITDGGYLKPENLLIDEKKSKALNEAIKLLEGWKQELEDDEMLIEY